MNAHHEWLSLIEISGPFLAVPVLKEAFPQGLDVLDTAKRQRLRQAYDEWREALDTGVKDLHAAWIDEVLSHGLELDDDGCGDVLKRRDWCAAHLNTALPEHGVSLSPDFAVVGDGDAPLMLVQSLPPDVELDATMKQDGWTTTAAERMVALCRAAGCRLGLVTNGERWMLVDAPVGAVTTFASWYARIWAQEPVTLQAFVNLLGIRRFFVDESERLPALLDRSLQYQDEVTDTLGEQVRRAVEVLIQALDKADQDRDRKLLCEVKEAELYEAALTVMMRLIFLLAAEERGLLLLGDERYEANYALSPLRMHLRAESEEILERRWDAWSRLLALFRAVYGGIGHMNLRLPALGGSLFDPDRFPFLEGRAKGTCWDKDAAQPLPIDNRTVLLLLDAIQIFQGRTLSYRALDVEQIGYVYEGLLERTVRRAAEVTLELDATKSARSPWVTLAELESARLAGGERLAELLRERTGSSPSRVRKDLANPVDDALADRVLTACYGDTALRDRIRPFAHLVRTDPWGYPLVYPDRAFMVTLGADRRETGTHYTPKSLTETIVATTLEPVVYVGPAEGRPREEWALKSSGEILDLKVCDPAMGSGAFLVQACRYLGERLVDAWRREEEAGKFVTIDGEALEQLGAAEPLPAQTDERLTIARRLVAERCLYGVDINPLAVELAKLSIWLVTLAKNRLFGFLDHNLRCGDSLLGIHRLDQLTEFSLHPGGQGQLRLFGRKIEEAVNEAVALRRKLRAVAVRDIRDVEEMQRLHEEARRKIDDARLAADALIGEALRCGGNARALEDVLAGLAVIVGEFLDGRGERREPLTRQARQALAVDLPVGKTARRPLHWPLEFPEVFSGKGYGFNAITGNPPFLGGRRQKATLGAQYQSYIANVVGDGGSINADLCAFFFRRAGSLISKHGSFGLVATNSLGQGATREMGLEPLLKQGLTIYRAISNFEWTGAAGVTVAVVWLFLGDWNSKSIMDGKFVSRISSYLSSANVEDWSQKELAENELLAFQGSNILGSGFVLSQEEARKLINANSANALVIKPFVRGEDFNSTPDQRPIKWIIDFQGWPLKRSLTDSQEAPVAQDFPECLDIVERLVKPKRNEAKRNAYRERWWQYAERCVNLYDAVKGLRRVIFQASPSKHICFGFAESGCVYSGPHTVIASESVIDLALLQSSIHTEWAWQFCSTMRNSGIRYNPSDFRKFPRPKMGDAFVELAVDFHNLRQRLMQERGYGFTRLYNEYHHPSSQYREIVKLRTLQQEIDQAIAIAYGWNDLTILLKHRQTKQGTRFTLSAPIAEQVLERLTALNQQRYAAEVAQGLHGNADATATRRTPRAAAAQPTLNLGASPTTLAPDTTPTAAILAFLQQAHDGWHAKADILEATGIAAGQWQAAINALLDAGKVERQGERRGARYCAMKKGGS